MSAARQRIGCVITSYNYGVFLADAIASVLSQTRPADCVVVVDDGSTDDTVKVAKSFGGAVQLISQPNQGVVAARNRGASEIDGELLFFLDADDTLSPGYVDRLAAALESSEAAFAYCDWRFFGQEEGVIRSCPWNPRKLLYRNYIIGAALMRRTAFDAVGGYSEALNQRASFEDWDLWLSMVERGMHGVYVPEALFNYRLHGTGRNGPALKQRPAMEASLRARHRALYNNPVNRLYLSVFGTASRIRNTMIQAPGT